MAKAIKFFFPRWELLLPLMLAIFTIKCNKKFVYQKLYGYLCCRITTNIKYEDYTKCYDTDGGGDASTGMGG